MCHLYPLPCQVGLLQVPSLAGLSCQQTSLLCSAMKPVHVDAGRPVLIAGNPNTFYVVEAGTCNIIENGTVCPSLGPELAHSRKTPLRVFLLLWSP